MGMAVTVCAMLSPAVLNYKAQADVGKVGLVLAGKGSALQWVMAALYHVDTPPSNVSLSAVNTLLASAPIQAHILNKVGIAMGDSIKGTRLVGVDSLPAYLALFDAIVESGTLATLPMQAAIGASAAARLKLTVGSQFFSNHGLESNGASHDDSPYTVTAILKPTGTVLDTLIVTPIESIWLAHEGKPRDALEATILADSRDITAVLIQYRHPISALALPALLDKAAPDIMTVAPVAKQLQRLWVLFEPFFKLLAVLAWFIALTAGAGVLLAARLTQAQRLRDLGILRMLGTPPKTLLGLLALEAIAQWLAACMLLLIMLCVASWALLRLMPLPWHTLASIALPTIAMSASAALVLLLVSAVLTAYRLLKQSPAQVLQSR